MTDKFVYIWNPDIHDWEIREKLFAYWSDINNKENSIEALAYSVHIYPNPTSSFIHIRLEAFLEGDLEIYSLNGQLVYRRAIRSGSEQIDMSPYAKGIYFVTVRSDGWVRTQKVVKY